MAKIKRAIFTTSGKINNRVHVDSKTYGHHERDLPKKGAKKDEPVLKKNYSRTAFLDALGSELNTIIKNYAPHFKSSDFYTSLHSLFRKEDENNRLLLLLKLKGLEINPAYPTTKLGQSKTIVNAKRNKILVNLQITDHPRPGKHNANGYYYEVFLLRWDKTKKPATHSSLFSQWIPISNGRSPDETKPEFDFFFPKPAGTTHWLLCIRQRLGANEEEIEAHVAEAMRIVDIGTFDKAELALLKKREEKRMQERPEIPVKKKVEQERVKAKRFH